MNFQHRLLKQKPVKPDETQKDKYEGIFENLGKTEVIMPGLVTAQK